MTPLCALLATGMLYCGGNDFRPVNDIRTKSTMAELQQAQVHVDGYTRRDGTYVAPYNRGLPDGLCYNNKAGC